MHGHQTSIDYTLDYATGAPTCPHCGEEWDEIFFGYEIYLGTDGVEQAVLEDACCEAICWDIQEYGFADATGISPERMMSELTDSDVREVYVDGVLRRSLQEIAPGLGVKGWQREVFADIDENHSHHDAPQGWKFGVAVYNGHCKVGVAIVGRPVSRMLQANQPDTLEVTRVCVWGDARLRRNAASKLYAACAAEAKKIGATKLITYTLETEECASLRASNWTPVAHSKGGSHNRPSRPRTDKAPTCPKTRWERGLNKRTRKAVERTAVAA